MAFENTSDVEATQVMPRNLAGRTTVGALFADRLQAQQAIQDLKAAGFVEDQIGVALRDNNEQGQLVEDTGVHTHAGSGATTGAVVGGLLGLLVGIGALAIPGIGPVIAGGALAHALGAGAAGAVTGAATGGILGGLVGLGIPEHEAQHFESGFNQGRALVTVNAGNRAAQAVEILERDGGDTGANVGVDGFAQPQTDTSAAFPTMPALSAAPATPFSSNQPLNTGATPPPTGVDVAVDAGQRLRLHEEQLDVQKQHVQTGEVTMHKEVITETRTIDVPVTREEVVIERHAITPGQAATPGTSSALAEGEVLRVPVMEEQVTVQKTPIVTEEISLGKREVTETQHVEETVRREEARIENPQNVDVLERNDTSTTR